MKTKPKHEKAFMKCAEAFAECSNAGLKKLGRTDELSLEVVVYYIKFGGIMAEELNLKGERFGRLLVLHKAEDDVKRSQTRWVCLCDCGKETTVLRGNLRSGSVKSCGCLAKEAVTTHGRSNTRQFSIWTDMKRRCNNENNIGFKSYGALGISYDERWEKFENFWDDMGDSYSDDLTLERVDPRKDYCKDNCEWVPKEDQSKNKKLYKTNKTGIDGTYISTIKGIEVLVAHFSIPNGKRARRTYSLRKYTLEEALQLAEDWRKQLKNSYNYGEFHGSTMGN